MSNEADNMFQLFTKDSMLLKRNLRVSLFVKRIETLHLKDSSLKKEDKSQVVSSTIYNIITLPFKHYG